MNKRKRITQYSIETERTVVVRRQAPMHAWCERCHTTVTAARPESAAALKGLTVRELYRRVESGTVHFGELEDGSLLVCLESIG